MTALVLRKTVQKKQPKLNQCFMLVDSNAHRPDLCLKTLTFKQEGMVSESLFPQIRMFACMIAASRYGFDADQNSPDVFTEEADWFAARILALNVRFFHLDITLLPMLQLANQRAEIFAKKHRLNFMPARSKMSLHSGRPNNLLIIEVEHDLPQKDMGIIGNSLFIKKQFNIS